MKIKCICPECGVEFEQFQSRVKQGVTRCSNKCRGKSMTGLKNKFYKPDGFINNWGYRMVSVNGRRTYEHIFVIEQHIGRRLEKGEEVHHVNRNKLDNRIENLQLLTTLEHKKFHRNIKTGKFITNSRFIETKEDKE